MPENSEESVIFTIHYDGEQISNHKMDLEVFLHSLQGFNSLLKEIAQEIGISSECLQIEIQPLENGGVKAYIVASLCGLVLGHLGECFLTDIHLYERLQLPHLANRVNQFLDRKKSASNYKDFSELTAGLDGEATHIMMNKEVHAAAEQFTSALQDGADVLELSSTTNQSVERIIRGDLPNFRNPFTVQDLEERLYDEEKVLRLDGPRSIDSEWFFYQKNKKGKWDKTKTYRAIVLDPFLLSLGRENSLKDLEDRDLFCTIRYKETKKQGNKKKSIEKYIIKCRLTADLYSE